MKDIPTVILASSSPRRHELMTNAGIPYSIRVSGCDETPVPNESPKEMVERLALAKASVVADDCPQSIVVGADTTVFIGEKILGKPDTKDDAREMLRTIQDATHEVWGGVAILWRDRNVTSVSSYVTRVTMVPMTDDAINWYVETGEPMDKAGSYAIQGLGLQFVDRIEGSYSNVVGLDIAALSAELVKLGVRPLR